MPVLLPRCRRGRPWRMLLSALRFRGRGPLPEETWTGTRKAPNTGKEENDGRESTAKTRRTGNVRAAYAGMALQGMRLSVRP